MEALELRRLAVTKALAQLKSSLEIVESDEFEQIYDKLRDSVIQRFEFSMDTFWKFLKEYLQDREKVIIKPASPRNVFRNATTVRIIKEQELKSFLDMIEDRNLSLHTYNEKLAEEISQRIQKHYEMMLLVLKRCKL